MQSKQLQDRPFLLVQDSSNSGANVQRLEQESNNQMKEIQSNIAAKKKEVSHLINANTSFESLHILSAMLTARLHRELSSLSAWSARLLQVMDKLLGYVTNVDFKAGASHM